MTHQDTDLDHVQWPCGATAPLSEVQDGEWDFMGDDYFLISEPKEEL